MSAPIVLELDGRTVRVTNPDRELWTAPPFTKLELIEWYRAVAPALLPHVFDKPMTLARFPEGVLADGWYQMNCRGPDWMPVAEVASRGGARLRYCRINDVSSLVWVANQGTIELHPFLARYDRCDHPDALVFDLDPGEPANVATCCAVALLLREKLAEDGLEAWAKTSGRNGLHLYVPLDETQSFADTRAYARAMERGLAAEHPGLVTDRMDRTSRKGRVLIDWGQNHPARSMIAAYSLRATVRPGVSTPVRWEEVDAVAARRAPPFRFAPVDVRARLERLGDLFAPMRARRQRIPFRMSTGNDAEIC